MFRHIGHADICMIHLFKYTGVIEIRITNIVGLYQKM